MMRMQIQLTNEQHRLLKRWATRLGISLSEAVRRCIDERLSRPEHGTERDEIVRQAFTVCEKYADPEGISDVARRHDEHLARSYRR
jgi:hypothetical protein